MRWALALVSAGIAALVGWALLPRLLDREEGATGGVESIEMGAEVDELFASRQRPRNSLRQAHLPEIRSTLLVREVYTPEEADVLFPVTRTENFSYDPVRGFLRSPEGNHHIGWPEHPKGGWWNRTNLQGMREDDDVAEPASEWRVIVTGDSHTEGACANDESFPNLLEDSLVASGFDAEVWNAGCGVYSFYEYLGTVESLLALEPDVFVVTVYGGNDFSGAMRNQRFFNRRPIPKRPWREFRPYLDSGGETPEDVFHQDLEQAIYFRINPEDLEVAICTAVDVSLEIAAICEREGVELVIAYLPPPSSAQPLWYTSLYMDAANALNISLDEVRRSDDIADEWLMILRDSGLRVLDLRPPFRASEKPLYWFRDLHISLAGHALVAQELEAVVAPLLVK